MFLYVPAMGEKREKNVLVFLLERLIEKNPFFENRGAIWVANGRSTIKSASASAKRWNTSRNQIIINSEKR
jgi:hypothetical protein